MYSAGFTVGKSMRALDGSGPAIIWRGGRPVPSVMWPRPVGQCPRRDQINDAGRLFAAVWTAAKGASGDERLGNEIRVSDPGLIRYWHPGYLKTDRRNWIGFSPPRHLSQGHPGRGFGGSSEQPLHTPSCRWRMGA